MEGPSLQVSVPTTFYFQACSVILAHSVLAPSIKVLHDQNHLMFVCCGNFCDVEISSAKRSWRHQILLIKIIQPKVRQELLCCGVLDAKYQPLKFCSVELTSLPGDVVWRGSDLKIILNIYSVLLQRRLSLPQNLKFKTRLLWAWGQCFLLSEMEQSISLMKKIWFWF